MPNETGVRCALQMERDCRSSSYSDAVDFGQDICDVTLWIREKFQLSSLQVWIDRHYGHGRREISDITVMMSPQHPDYLDHAAQAAFLALGYVIRHNGGHTYGCPLCDGGHSNHEALKAYARIEGALRAWQSR